MMLMRNPACKATQSTCLPSYSRKYAVTRSRQCAPGRQRVGTVASAVGTTPTATTYEDVWRGFAESAQGKSMLNGDACTSSGTAASLGSRAASLATWQIASCLVLLRAVLPNPAAISTLAVTSCACWLRLCIPQPRCSSLDQPHVSHVVPQRAPVACSQCPGTHLN